MRVFPVPHSATMAADLRYSHHGDRLRRKRPSQQLLDERRNRIFKSLQGWEVGQNSLAELCREALHVRVDIKDVGAIHVSPPNEETGKCRWNLGKRSFTNFPHVVLLLPEPRHWI